jgi:Ran GTPase-activating protein (RanGAP) involved in mRNA processing and transport
MNQVGDLWYIIYLHLDPQSIYHLFLSCRGLTAIHELIEIVKESRGQLMHRQLLLKHTTRSRLCPYLQTRTCYISNPWDIHRIEKTNANHLIVQADVFHEWKRVPCTIEKLQVGPVGLPWVYQVLSHSPGPIELNLCVKNCDENLLPWLLVTFPTLRVLTIQVCGPTVPCNSSVELERPQLHLRSLCLIAYPFTVEKNLKALPNITKLELTRMGLRKDALRHLLQNFKRLEHLCIDENPIGTEGIKSLASIVKERPTIRSLSAASTSMGFQGFQYLEACLQQLIEINVSDCFLGSEAIMVLLNHMPKKLQHLCWNNNSILPLHFSLLISHLPVTLKRLELQKTQLRSESIAALVNRLIECPYLEHVSLSRNPIGKSAIDLARLFDHPCLECLCMTDIGIYDQSTLIHEFSSARICSIQYGNPLILCSQKLVVYI